MIPRAARGLGVLALVAIAALPSGCGRRDRANPLDPRNPATSGGPTGFTAVALSGQVVLTWNPSPGPGAQVYRRSGPTGDFIAVSDVLAPRNTLFIDASAANDVTHYYRLQFVGPQGPVGPAATAQATPSRVVPWAVDANRGSLLRLAADGREIAFEEPSMGEPAHLAGDPVRDLLWVVDGFGGRVLIYVASLGVRIAVTGFTQPSVAAVVPADGSAWISDFNTGFVRHVLSSGSPGTPASVGPVDGPLGVDVDPTTSSLWVCERRAGKVRRYAADGTPAGAVDFTAPSRVSVDSANGEAWVTSFETGRVVHLSSGLATLHTVTGLTGPVGVAVDPRRGRIWVADPAGSRLFAYRRDGTEEFRVDGLAGARDVAVERASGEAWVTMNGTVARIAPDGTVLATVRGLSAPVGIALDRLDN